MNEQPRRQLCDLIKTYGPSLYHDPRRCEALLKDLCGAYQTEIFVIIQAQKQQVPQQLQQAAGHLLLPATMLKLARQLERNLALTESAAHWAVETWGLALGLSVPKTPMLPSTNGKAVPTPSASAQQSVPVVPARGWRWLLVGVALVVAVVYGRSITAQLPPKAAPAPQTQASAPPVNQVEATPPPAPLAPLPVAEPPSAQPLAVVKLIVSPTGTQPVGSEISLNVQTSGLSDPLVRFDLRSERQGEWLVLREYADQATFRWAPSQPGRYQLRAVAKSGSVSAASDPVILEISQKENQVTR